MLSVLFYMFFFCLDIINLQVNRNVNVHNKVHEKGKGDNL